MKKVLLGGIISALLLILLISGISCVWDDSDCSGESLQTSELINYLQQGKSPEGGNYTLAKLTIDGTSLKAKIDGKTYCTTIPEYFDAFQIFATQIEQGKLTLNYKKQ